MKRLFDILSLFKEYFILALFILISLSLLAQNDNVQIRTIRALALAAVGSLQDAFGFIPNYFELKQENKVLREQNVNLADEVSRLREAKLENIRLRQLLDLKERSHFDYAGANILGKNLQLMRNTITLDVGEENGVRVNMPVVSDAGLVGKIVATSSSYAVVQILLNKEFRASAKVQRGRVDGIIVWQGGDHVLLKNVAKTLDVQVGDVVITSDYSSFFPAGIKIGVVSRTEQPQSELFQIIEVKPSVDFARLEEVFVAKYIADSSRIALERRSK